MMAITPVRTLATLGCIAALPASAALIGIDPITSNSGLQNTVASQISIDVTDAGVGLVDIKITNNGDATTDFVVTQFYLDDNAPVVSGFNTLPANWGAGATPPELPSGNNVGFVSEHTADADNPQPGNGIDLGESATFRFNLAGGASYQDVLDAIDDGSTRIGLHVQSIGSNEDSDSFVTPEPGSMVLLMGGAALLVKRRRR